MRLHILIKRTVIFRGGGGGPNPLADLDGGGGLVKSRCDTGTGAKRQITCSDLKLHFFANLAD